MKKSIIKLIVGSLVSAGLMITSTGYFEGHEYFEMINSTVFVLATTQFLYFSSEVNNKARKVISE